MRLSRTKGNYILEKDEFVWKIISRFDHYIGTTNTKATVIVAFNTFVFSAIVLKWADLLLPYQGQRAIVFISSLLLLVAALSSLVSLAAVFLVINPFLKSPKKPAKYHSIIFFGHVAEYDKADEYLQCVQSSDEDKLTEDLCIQAHALAQGLDKKFRIMKIAVYAILFFQLPSLALLILIKTANAVFTI